MKRLIIAIRAFFMSLTNPAKVEDALWPKSTQVSNGKDADLAHLRLLSMLQQKGRLVDFLKEDMRSYSDAQIGGAVRKIHDDCASIIEEVVTLRPIFEESEGKKITVPVGYDSAEIKVVGNVHGEPPFNGILRHRGWRAHKLSLPKQLFSTKSDVIAHAEIEIL